MTLHHFLLQLHRACLSVLVGVLLTGHLLGFVGAYRAVWVIPSALLLTLGAYAAYGRLRETWQLSLAPPADETHMPLLLARTLVITALMVFALVFGWRMITFPYSEFGALIPADFIDYHAIKAIDLVYNGTAWNLGIPYGQYPIGYEALLAFPLLLTGTLDHTGMIHLLITLTLWLTLYALLRRYTRLAPALCLALALTLCFVRLIYSPLVTIGKNDVLLALTVLLAVLYAPLSRRDDRAWHPIGLAYATLLSIATKGSGLYVLVFLWALVLWDWFRAWRQGKGRAYLTLWQFALLVLLMFPGGWWVLRNLVIMGQPYSPEVSNFFQLSILANLDNPVLYDWDAGLRRLLVGGVGALGVSAALLWSRRFSWRLSLLVLVLIVNTMATPLSAFDTIERTALNIEWRFMVLPLLLLLVLSVALVSPALNWLYERVNQARGLRYAASVAIVVAAGLLLLRLDAPDFFTLRESSPLQYPPDSIYAYVDENLSSGVVYLDNTNGFYLRYANPELSFTAGNAFPLRMPHITQPPTPDYTAFIKGRALPQPTFGYLTETYEWRVLYDDATGTLYQRVPQ